MNLNKRNVEKIIFILCSVVLFCALLLNISALWRWFWYVLKILLPVILGLAVAFIMTPLAGSFEHALKQPNKKLKFKGMPHKWARIFSTTLAFLVIVAVIAMLVIIIIPEVKTAFIALANTLPGLINTGLDWIATHIPEDLGLEVDFSNLKGVDIIKVFDYVTDILKLDSSAGDVFGGVMGVATSVVGGVFTFAMGLIIGFRLILQREAVGRFFRRFVKAYFSERMAGRIFELTSLTTNAFKNFMIGQLTEALALGTMCLVGMTVFGLPYAGAVSAIVGFGAIIPIFGAWMAGILGFLLTLSVSPLKALFFVIFLACLQALDGNFVYPRIVGNSMDLPGLLVFLAVLIGGDIAGFAGMLLGVPFCSVAYTLITNAIDRRLKEKEKKKEAKSE